VLVGSPGFGGEVEQASDGEGALALAFGAAGGFGGF
jgi:hypothetical protein